MATYTYRCTVDGPVDVRAPIGTAPVTIACPACGVPSPRVITAPMLGLADRGRMAVIDRTEHSRAEPDVVSALPRRSGRPAASLDPRTRTLPRP
ncbi:MAG: zinc ribbon domain-containing protein [Pseudonocardia sp.]